MKNLVFGIIVLSVFYLRGNVYSESEHGEKAETVKMKFAIGSAFYGEGELKNA